MIYSFKCSCGNKKDVWASMSEISNLKPVCDCGLKMYRQFSSLSIYMNPLPPDFGKGMNPEKEKAQIDRMLEEQGKL